MKKSRLVVAGIAAVAMLGAFFLSGQTPPPQVVRVPEPAQPAPQIKTTDVLVANGDIPMGNVVNQQDVRWQPFPNEALSQHVIQKTGDGEAELKSVVGAIARHPFFAGEPMRTEKLIKANGSGFLAAILPPGKRAVAVTTEPSGATSAGGFILPNDYVDIVRVSRDEEAARLKGTNDVLRAELVVSNVRVLAIGQNVQERNGEKFITSQTATLELDPRQAEQVVLAQRQGSLSLVLRSIQDVNKVDAPVAEDNNTSRRPLTLVRFGMSSDLVAK